MIELCVLGFVYVEVDVPDHRPPAPGTECFVPALRVRLGGALNTASVARALGAEVALAAPRGDGVTAPGIDAALRQLEIAPIGWPVAGDPAVSLIYGGARDRAFVSAADLAGLAACPGLPAARWIHVAGLAEALAATEQLAAARAAGSKISVSGSWVPDALEALCQRRDRPWDLLLASGAEARHVAGSPERAFAALAGCAKEVVITDGARGAAVAEGDTITWIAAEPAAIVDTTGAGDGFAAGYLVARLRGASSADAARLGNRVAARILGVPGGVAWDPSTLSNLEELE